jgi:hypothetical protein
MWGNSNKFWKMFSMYNVNILIYFWHYAACIYTSLLLYKRRDFLLSPRCAQKPFVGICTFTSAYWPYKVQVTLHYHLYSSQVSWRRNMTLLTVFTMTLCFSVDIACSENISNTRPKIEIGFIWCTPIDLSNLVFFLFNECMIYDKS